MLWYNLFASLSSLFFLNWAPSRFFCSSFSLIISYFKRDFSSDLRPHLKEEMNCKQGPKQVSEFGLGPSYKKKVCFFSFTYSELSPQNRFYSVTNRGIVPI